MGVLGWPPAAFWAAPTHDLSAGLDGWMLREGRGGGGDLDDDDVARLRRMLKDDGVR